MKRNAPSIIIFFAFVAAMYVFTGSASAALLGVVPQMPEISFDSLGSNTTTFDPGTGLLNISASPASYIWATRKSTAISAVKNLSIQVYLDSNGAIIPNQAGDQLVIVGNINTNSVYTGPAYNGTLLTGKITRFGFFNSGVTDMYDFRFTPTGGAMYDLYKSGDIGITVTSANSTFDGVFNKNFLGSVQGTLGAIPGPHFSLTETCTDAEGQGPIQFSATITNTGSESLSNITCANSPVATLNDVPTGLAIGATATFTGSYVPESSPSNGTVTCNATGTGSQVVITTNSTSTCKIGLGKIVVLPMFSISESCSNAAAPGQPIAVSATITNTGSDILTGFSCSSNRTTLTGVPVVNLAPGGTAQLTGSYIPTANGSTDTITCSAKGVSSTVVNSTPAAASCSITTAPALSLTETCANAPAPGQPIIFTATIKNSGNEALTGVSCTDGIGGLVTLADIAVGGSITNTFNYTDLVSPKSDTITCGAKGAISSSVVSSTPAAASCSIITAPALSLTETCANAPAPGQPMVFTATIKNSGNEALTGVSCTDGIGGPVPLADIAVGGSVTKTFNYTDLVSPKSDTITCGAKGTISSTVVNSTPAAASCSITTAPALSLTETCANAPAPGQPMVFTASIKNSGNEALTGVSCTDGIGGLVPLADIAVGGSITNTFNYTDLVSPKSDTITCGAKGAISSTVVNSTPAAASCSITTAPALSLTETCANAPAPGQPMVFTATINNSGNEALTGVSCTDGIGGSVTLADIAVGGSVTKTFNYTDLVSPKSDTITCSAKGAISSSVVSSTPAAASCSITTKPALSLTESCANAPSPGSASVLSATLTNTGNESLTGIVCTDSNGASLAGVPSTLAVNGVATFTGSYIPQTSGSADAITCTATGAINKDSAGITSNGTCNITTKPALSLTESCTNAPSPGSASVLSATLTNTGNESLTGIVCTDSNGASLAGVPSTLAVNGVATFTGSYIPQTSGSADAITCTATGAVNKDSAGITSNGTCNITSAPALSLTESCADAPAPGQSISILATVANTGNEDLTGVSCSDNMGVAFAGIPATLAAGKAAQLSGSYLPAGKNSTETITCKANGLLNGAVVSTNSSATCTIATAPSMTVAETCTNAPAPGQAIALSAVIKNNGNESLTGLICNSSNPGVLFTGMPATLAAGASATVTGSYVPSGNSSVDTISCSANGVINGRTISANSSATCSVESPACIQLKKQVSTSCVITGSKDKHCKTGEVKEDYCKRGDADRAYCNDSKQDKEGYCHEVTRKETHCGASESKGSYCAKSDCDHDYCGQSGTKDDYCKVPVAPACVPVWLDADTPDTAATMKSSSWFDPGNGNDLLDKIGNGTYDSYSSIKLFQHAISDEGTDDGNVRNGDSDDKTDDDDKTSDSVQKYNGHIKQSTLAYRMVISNCGSSDLAKVTLSDATIAVTGYEVGALKAGDAVTLTSAQIPQLDQPKQYCSNSFVNTATVTAFDSSGKNASASDDAWIICNTKSCAFSNGYWINHLESWPVTTFKLGTISYTQNQLLSIISAPASGNGLLSLGQQLIAGKLNVATGTIVPAAVQQAINSADALIGSLMVPPVGSGTLSASTVNALVKTLDSFSSGTFPGGPNHCGDTQKQQCSGSIGGFIWDDSNKDGVEGSREVGLAGVKVVLSNGTSAITDTTGHYLFTGLCKGNYTVKVAAPCNYVATTASSVAVVLSSDNSSNRAADFGFVKPPQACSGKIGDFVWDDLNKNGAQDGSEPGLANVQVTLSNGIKTVTNASGYYQFTNLCAGDYIVSVSIPSGYMPTAVASGANTAKDSKGSPVKVTLNNNNSSVQNIDFGFYKIVAPVCTGTIGNFIWNDVSRNGIQNYGEKGIAGVTVLLGNGQTTVTDADGHYQFAGLCAGNYTVTVTTPNGFTPSPALQGTSRTLDSNSGSAAVTLSNNYSSDATIDFGFWKLPAPLTTAKGCSLGYWKNHTGNWSSALHPTDSFDTVFGITAFTPDITLLQALNSTGGGISNLARQSAAALLNAQDSRITGFPLSVSEVKSAVKNAVQAGSYDALATTLDSYNNLSCPLN